MLKLERYANGKWNVLTSGFCLKRVGHIVGGNQSYLAEMGPTSLGYFKTLKDARAAIAAELCRCEHPRHSAECPNPHGCWCDHFSAE